MNNNKLKYLVTGVPRSGTGYMYKLLESAGIKTGHEKIFTVKGYDSTNLKNKEADSSWLAVPFLNESILSNTKVIHVIRNPYDVVSSILHIGLFNPKQARDYTRFIYKYLPDIKNLDRELEKAVSFYVRWSNKINKRCDFKYKIKDCPSAMLESAGIIHKKELLFNNTEYNARGYHDTISYNDIATLPTELSQSFMEIADEY